MQVQATTIIRATPEAVFAFITVPENGPRWQGGAVSTSRSGSGPVAVGTTMTHEGRWLWMRVPTVATVVVHDPPRRYGYDIASSMTPDPSRMRYALDSTTDGTRLTLSNEASLRGWMRPFEPLFQRSVQRMFERDVARLKAVIEGDLSTTPAGS